MNVSKDLSAKQERILRDAEILTPVAQTTTDNYADVVGSKLDAACYESVAFTCKNTGGANGLKWQVLASIDDITYETVQSEAVIAFGASGSYTVSPAPYRYYKVQVKAQVGASQTTAVVAVIGK
jgi:hypothetical protein